MEIDLSSIGRSIGRSSENICSNERGSRKEKYRMKLSLQPKLVEKLVWVAINSFCSLK